MATHILRDYQRVAIDTLYAWFAENSGNPLIVIPTAGGKSLIIAQFIREAMEHPDTRILVVTHVKELIQQNFSELIGIWPDAPAGIYSAGLGKRDIGKRILFCGIQSIHRRAYNLQKVDLVLVDEGHLIPRSSDTMYGRFLGQLREINPYCKVVGFTATPFRLDSGRLDRGDDAIFQEVAYEANIRDLIDAGFLCPPISPKEAVTQIDTSNVPTRAGEFVAKPLEASAIDPVTIEAHANEMCRHGRDRRGWLFFGAGLDHCRLMRDALRERGITCETIFGETESSERARIISAFKRQEIRCLSSMGVLTTGFNARHVDLIGVGRPTKSTGLWVQMVGRGTRTFPGKSECMILDFGGNIERHGPVDQPKPKNEPSGAGEEVEQEAPEKHCQNCGALCHISVRECATCGAPFVMNASAMVDLAPAHADILSRVKPPEWADVTSVSYRGHNKPGKPTSMCVSYWCGMSVHREWVCFEHPGGARLRAVEWWHKRAPAVACPDTTKEALANKDALAKPSRVLIREAAHGKFTEIVGVAF